MNYWGIYDNNNELVFDSSGQALIMRTEDGARFTLKYLKKYSDRTKNWKAIRIPFIHTGSILDPNNIVK